MNTSVPFGFTNTLVEVLQKQKPTHIGIAFDTPAATFRDEIFTEYKANRQETPEDIRSGVPLVKEIIRGEPFANLAADSIESYFDSAKTVSELRKLEQAYPAFAKVYDLNEFLGFGKTPDGNSIYALQVSKTPNSISRRPKIIYIGQHHARELMTHHAVLDLAKAYLQQISAGQTGEAPTEPTPPSRPPGGESPEGDFSSANLEKMDVWFVPVVNPDGLDYVFSHNRWWRKNRKQDEANPDSYGVDLNRNYDFDWGKCGQNSTVSSSEVYMGSAPSSEIEVQVMDRFNALLKSQLIISFHSSGDEVLFPYVCRQGGAITDQSVYYGLRDRLADEIGFGKRYASSSGEDFEHYFHRHGSYAFLLEIGQEFQPSFDVYQTTVLPSVLKTLPFLIAEVERDFVTVEVVDAESGRELENVSIEFAEIPILMGELRKTDQFGILRRKTPPEVTTLHITASRDGYEPTEVLFESKSESKSILIKLQKRTDSLPKQYQPQYTKTQNKTEDNHGS
jgi:hypothetical protein